MSMLGGGIAGVFGSIMGGFYLDAVLHRSKFTDNNKGGGSQSFTDQDCKAQLDRVIERMVEGNIEKLQGILMLQVVDGVQLAEPSTDDEITIKGRWQIATIEIDPAGSYWLLGGRKSPN